MPGLAGRLLQRGTRRRQLRPAVGGHRHVAGEPVLGVTVGQLDVALLDALLLPGVAGRGQEAAAATELAVGDVGRAGLGHLAGGPARADRLHDHGRRSGGGSRTAPGRGSRG